VNKWDQKRKIIRRYDLTAQLYDVRYAEEQDLKYRTALELLNVTRSSKVLDVGCGTGLLFRHVAAEAQTVVGMDISGKLLLQAKKRARNFRNVHLVQADADHIPFKHNYFSVVFAFTVLQNLPEPLETLKEVKRIAERDAPIVMTGLKKAFSLDAFRELLQSAGLRVVSLKDDDALKCHVAVSARS
jgi:demethylmenaquinone methyltransferase/2-methoxy-6-polyprenyl-1,4-benzoquinol methylase